jgi:hypothetical protein
VTEFSARCACLVLASAACLVWGTPATAASQDAPGSIAGKVLDGQALVVPGAAVRVSLEPGGGVTATVLTGQTGEFLLTGLVPGVYSVSVTLKGFRTATRGGVQVAAGVRVAVPPVVLQVSTLETITIDDRDHLPLIQSDSGERSAIITLSQLEALPISAHSFQQFLALVPGVNGVSRVGGGGQDNYTLDGVSIVDTGNNGLMGGLNLPVDAIDDLKVVTSGYQAEYGRSSGLQIAAITRSGTNQFRFSMFQYNRDSGANANAWANTRNGYPRAVSQQIDVGYTVGGPVGRPGGENKLFFFYSHEYRPRRSGNFISNMLVPTEAERRGDFSGARDQNGRPYTLIYDASTGLPKEACSSSDQRACFQDGGVVGRIPAHRLYGPGMAILNQYPLPNTKQPIGRGYNYETVTPIQLSLAHTPLVRLDFVPTSRVRLSGKWVGSTAIVQPTIGRLPGFDDTLQKFPLAFTTSATLNYTWSLSTVLDATYGVTQNRLGSPPTSPFSNRESVGCPADLATVVFDCSAGRLAMLFPGADFVDPRYYEYGALGQVRTPFFVNGRAMLPPQLAWAVAGTTSRLSTVGCVIGTCAPPSLNFPAFMNINRTHDLAINLTSVHEAHIVKAGVYRQHSFKAQNLASGVNFQGFLNFGNDTNNPLDTGVPYSNAATGVFSLFAQQSKFIEGRFVYDNVEWYAQDKWKVSSNLTLDYGVRFVHQTPQYDQLGQVSNFLPDRWSAAQAPVLYTPACVSIAPCAGSDRRARDPRSGALLSAGSASLIGQAVLASGSDTNGIAVAGNGIPKTGYAWPSIGVAPRIGVAYDVNGAQKIVLRGALGLYFDRPDGNTVFGTVGNPPVATGLTQQWGSLVDLAATARSVGPVPTLRVYYKDSKLPSDVQWNAGAQLALPWASALDVSYVGHHSFNVLGGQQAQGAVDLNAVDLGAALAAAGQDPTQPAGTPLNSNLLRSYRGYSNIFVQWGRFHRTFHSVQTSFTRRMRGGVSAGMNWTYSISDRGNTNLPSPQLRLDHVSDGTYAIRADQAKAEELFEDQGVLSHLVVANFVWQVPAFKANARVWRGVAWLFHQSQFSGIFRFDTGSPYDVGYTYQSGGGTRLTGSPDYNARIVIAGEPGSGCSSNQYRQFNTAAFRGPVPGSDGLESGRNILHGCGDHRLDLAITKAINIGGKRQLILRGDIMNVFDSTIYNSRNTIVQFTNPVDQGVVNPQFLADGQIDPGRAQPQNAGFGAATSALSPRLFQGQVRIKF